MEMTKHVPVMIEEALEMAALEKGMTVVDATLGGGGYTREIYKRVMPGGTIIACDQDADAIIRFKESYPEIAKDIKLVHSNYSHIRKILKDECVSHIDVIVADLGLSSDQLEEGDRGFSFLGDNDIDMRMDQSAELRAYEVVNQWTLDDLRRIITDYGDERFAGRIARAICQARPIESTEQLARVISDAVPHIVRKKMKIHPATKTFQAIRIAVNDEYEHLKIFLTEGIEVLQESGKFVVVSFHSGEDRLVKNIFRENARGCICAEDMPVCRCEHEPQVRILTKKPIAPTDEEVKSNPRSRSARLRSVEKIKTKN